MKGIAAMVRGPAGRFRLGMQAAVLFALFALPGVTVSTAVDPRGFREDLQAWSAWSDPDPAVADAPSHCDPPAVLRDVLQDDFGERLIRDGALQLWGSELSGTWTLVRAGRDSCVVASGIGFRADRDPDIYFAAVRSLTENVRLR